MRVLVVGSGGREHALAWKLAQSPELEGLHAAPGNPGIAELGSCHPVLADDADGLLALATSLRIDLVVVGPEVPLVAGLADHLRHGGVSVFGPSAAAARIEGSKAFAKEVLETAGVPTARALPVARAPCVVKADGLAAGKGVFVCHSDEELQAALAEVRRLGGRFLIEELLEGGEALGTRPLRWAASRRAGGCPRLQARRGRGRWPQHRRHGAYSPVDGDALDALVDAIHGPVLVELAARGAPFSASSTPA